MSTQHLRSTRRRLGLVVGAVTALLVAGMLVTGSAQAAAGCQVAYTVPSQWQGGFTADVRVTNLGDAVTGWSLAWTFPSGQRVTQAWNATVTSSGDQHTAKNVSYNATIPTNATVSFGFTGSWSGGNTAPTAFTLNGVACTGSGGGTPTPTSTASPSPTPSTSPSPSPTPGGDAMARVAAMQPGWGLGNTFDAIPDETAWGNPPVTQALLHQVRSQGYRSIRIPVTWSNHHGPAPAYTIDTAWLNRIRQVVDWSLAEGLYVMINLHHDSWQWINGYPADRTGVLSRYTALWTQLATTFRDHSSKLVFESINEPQFTGTSSDAQSDQVLSELNVEFVRLIRRSGGNNTHRLLVLPTLHTSSEQARLDALAATVDGLRDPDIAVTVHFYGWWPFSVNIAGGIRYDANVEQDLVDGFDRVRNTFVARGIPVIIGEWALLSYDYTRPGIIERGELLKFFEAVAYHARIRKLTTVLWDAGSFLNRNDLQWRDPGLFALMKAGWATRSATASADQVYVPRTGAITSKALTLNLNGAAFQGLRQGSTNLVDGVDYTLSGTTLTLTSAAVTRLVGNRAPGVNATIEARFSQGVPWQINIISYDKPTQAAATGTTSSFAIPTQFRGDQLATMEAKYADGSPAGPANWTSYKEFWSNFQPDYGVNSILLKPEFFAEVNDGPVTLTFHFWSGTQVTYRLTKSGSAVTGSPARLPARVGRPGPEGRPAPASARSARAGGWAPGTEPPGRVPLRRGSPVLRLHVGCAMWTHKSWQGRLLAHPLPAHERLRHYAGWCDAVEGNTTFYATPTRETVASWAQQTDPDFRFLPKLPKLITHERRLADADEALGAFLDAIEPLGPRAHALWIQLPGSFAPADVAALAGFLRRLPRAHRYAVEVRHPAFFTQPRAAALLEEVLTAADAEWIPFDTTAFFRNLPTSDAEREAWTRKPRLPVRSHALTDRPIVRYLGRDDPARTVEGWQRWVDVAVDWLREGRSPTVFVHTPDNADAPVLARRFHDEVRGRVPELAALPDPIPAAPLTLF